MSEYSFHLEKYRYGSKTECPNCGKKRCFVRYIDEQRTVRFLRRWASATTNTAAATTIRRTSIFRITPTRCPMTTAVSSESSVSLLSAPDRHRSRPLIFPTRLSVPHCRTTRLTRCIGISAEYLVRRRRPDYSIFTVSAHRQSGTARRSSGRRTM